jgi:hypothetical protein
MKRLGARAFANQIQRRGWRDPIRAKKQPTAPLIYVDMTSYIADNAG